MSVSTVFNVHLILGYAAWLLCFGTYLWPRLQAMDRAAAQRVIATLHSFRFFGLVFVVPGVVGAPTSRGDYVSAAALRNGICPPGMTRCTERVTAAQSCGLETLAS